MVLSKLKQIRDELKESAQAYDEAFKNTALVAAESLVTQHELLTSEISSKNNTPKLTQALNKEYFLKKYGSLKKTKEAYKKIYGEKSYGRSWQDFLKVAQELPLVKQPNLTLEERIVRIEKILMGMGYDLSSIL